LKVGGERSRRDDLNSITVKEVEESSVNNVGGRGEELLKTNILDH
jgi:hypothetical protein